MSGVCAPMPCTQKNAASSSAYRIDVQSANDLLPSFSDLLAAHELVGLGGIGEFHLLRVPEKAPVRHAQGDVRERRGLAERRDVLEAAFRRLRVALDRV